MKSVILAWVAALAFGPLAVAEMNDAQNAEVDAAVFSGDYTSISATTVQALVQEANDAQIIYVQGSPKIVEKDGHKVVIKDGKTFYAKPGSYCFEFSQAQKCYGVWSRRFMSCVCPGRNL